MKKKNESNRKKHGVGFEMAQFVFNDPLHISRQDRVENGEQRWQTMGIVGSVVLLLVAHTWQVTEDNSEHIRIISARRATRMEKIVYEKNV
ncbi:MAG: BrnT family toxin [Methylococcaceae bacterium]